MLHGLGRRVGCGLPGARTGLFRQRVLSLGKRDRSSLIIVSDAVQGLEPLEALEFLQAFLGHFDVLLDREGVALGVRVDGLLPLFEHEIDLSADVTEVSIVFLEFGVVHAKVLGGVELLAGVFEGGGRRLASFFHEVVMIPLIHL